MARKIRAAMAADNASDLLAALDDHYGPAAAAAPEPPALGALAEQKNRPARAVPKAPPDDDGNSMGNNHFEHTAGAAKPPWRHLSQAPVGALKRPFARPAFKFTPSTAQDNKE